MQTRLLVYCCALGFFVFFLLPELKCAPLTFVPITLVQPDGAVVQAYASGDEFYHWVHDKDEFTIVRDSISHFYVYAVAGKGVLLPSPYIVGRSDPAAEGLTPRINIFPDVSVERQRASAVYASHLSKTAVSGSRYNLVIFLRFAGEPEFKGTIGSYDAQFNSVTGPSLKQYYSEVSWNQVDVTSRIVQGSGDAIISYQDDQPRKYYLKYDADSNKIGYVNDRMARESSLLRKALTSVLPLIPSTMNLDGDNNGKVDNVIFIVSGEAAGWSDLLWPHMTTLSSSPAFSINGKTVSTYNFQLEKSFAVGVLCHELGHSFGMPDLYRYANTAISPCGTWDIMCSGSAHMSTYLKYKYAKWIPSIPKITKDGTYWLKASTFQTNNAYTIASPRSAHESFLVEYRRKAGLYENGLAGSGLIVYRIDDRVNGNSNGPPDEVYIYRPRGTAAVNGTISAAFLNAETGRTSINDTTQLSAFLLDGLPGGLNIARVGSATGDSIRFDVKIVTDVPITGKGEYASVKGAYSWIDISKTGTEIRNWMNAKASLDSSLDDGYTASAIPLGFDFTFYKQKFNTLFVGVNGLVSFTQRALNVHNGAASETDFGFFDEVVWPGNMLFPNSVAAAYFDFDLNRNDGYGGGRVMYQTIGDQFVLSWINVGTFMRKADTTNSFQLVLNRVSGALTINFKSFGIDSTRRSVMVGMQKDYSTGLNWYDGGNFADRIPFDGTSVVIAPVVTTVKELRTLAPAGFALQQNYPNPFNPSTTIRYSIPSGSAGRATLRVYDVLGRIVDELVDRTQSAGVYEVDYAGAGLTSGIYFYRLVVVPQEGGPAYTQTRKMIVQK
ncbi:MAG TPA: M6 family metalloprotease domain-containing protein [Bacteroidota bacterium]|nr:M6 family metalloprotease domain-containing protein [Bacteroidota bacterium]